LVIADFRFQNARREVTAALKDEYRMREGRVKDERRMTGG